MRRGRTQDKPSGRVWISALVLALLFHGIWWIGLTASAPEYFTPETRIPQAQVSLWTLPPVELIEEAAAEDPLAFRSPVLFALPSPLGFSRPLLIRGAGLRPPIQPPLDISMTLKSPVFARPDEPAVTGGGPPEDVRVRYEGPSLRPVTRSVFDGFPEPHEPVLRMEFGEGLREDLFEKRPLPERLVEETTASWEVEVFLSTDERGVVNRVLLERRADLERINQELSRSLYAWRVHYGEAPVSGRLRIYAVMPEGMPRDRREVP